jgi:DNA-binding CsgD family transcriptional regulator/PAS domain-containing protein
MTNEVRNGSSIRAPFAGRDHASMPEPEVVRWLGMYAEAAEDRRNATVTVILEQVNRLLSQYRRESAAYRGDYASRLRTLTEHMPIMLWTTDAALRVTTVAGDGLAAVDIDPSGTASLPLTVVLGTDAPSPEAVDAHARALRGHPANFEYERRSRWYSAHVQPLSGADGAIAGTIGLAIDVTDRKPAGDGIGATGHDRSVAEAIRAHRWLLDAMLAQFPNGSINVFDRSLCYLHAAGVGLGRVGLSPASLIGRRLDDVCSADAVARVRPFYERAFAGETVGFTVADFGRDYSIRVSPLAEPDGAIMAIIAIAQESPTGPPAAEALSPRERDIAALIRDGLTNRQIAERLGPATVTVSTQIGHMLERLGLGSRAQLGTWAAACGLHSPAEDEDRRAST